MTVEVLQNRQQIRDARHTLQRRGISCLSPRPHQWCKRLGLPTPRPVVGDYIKSWDVLRSIEAIEQAIPRHGPILDMGAYCSETLPTLHKLGYDNLVGIDLNPEIRRMPHADHIRFEQGDFLATSLPDASIDAAVAISAIEHGFDADRLLGEVCRVLAPGGIFVASFDYWPDKISTDGIKLFGLDWRIFSREEVLAFIEHARGYGLRPTGDIRLEATDSPIHFAGKAYTFGWLILRKITAGA